MPLCLSRNLYIMCLVVQSKIIESTLSELKKSVQNIWLQHKGACDGGHPQNCGGNMTCQDVRMP